jgi:transcriptional regulator with PAS, ATPase and Fis domain
MRPVIKHSIIGQSAAIRNIKRIITQVSTSDANVLITAETGTGKELVARSNHDSSKRRNEAFEPINCGAYPQDLLESTLFGHEKGAFTGAIDQRKGIFELANNGTVFLDEIGDAPKHLQTRLLRVLEEKEFKRVGGTSNVLTDFRLICATNQNLVQKVNEGEFRVDLFYRINVIRIHIPPLCDRMEDIPELIIHFLRELTSAGQIFSKSLQTDLETRAMMHNWPGNIRELKAYIETAIVLNDPEAYFKQELPLPPEMAEENALSGEEPTDLIRKFHTVSTHEGKAGILEEIILWIHTRQTKKDPLLYEQLKRRNLQKLIGCNKDIIIKAVNASCGKLENFIRDNGHFIKKKTSNSFIYPICLLDRVTIAL